jgi:hypothetical protein
MHLSANEIDVSFQYRYANQVYTRVRLSKRKLINLMHSTPKPSVLSRVGLSISSRLSRTDSLLKRLSKLSMLLLIRRKGLSRCKSRIKFLPKGLSDYDAGSRVYVCFLGKRRFIDVFECIWLYVYTLGFISFCTTIRIETCKPKAMKSPEIFT